MIFAPDNDPLLRARVHGGVLTTPQHVLAAGWRSFIGYDLDRACRRYAARCGWSTPGFPKDLDRLRNVCPQLEVGEVKGHGHLPQLFAPASFNAVLDGFLARCVAGAVAA